MLFYLFIYYAYFPAAPHSFNSQTEVLLLVFIHSYFCSHPFLHRSFHPICFHTRPWLPFVPLFLFLFIYCFNRSFAFRGLLLLAVSLNLLQSSAYNYFQVSFIDDFIFICVFGNLLLCFSQLCLGEYRILICITFVKTTGEVFVFYWCSYFLLIV